MKKPKVGDRIIVKEHWTETEICGKVDLLLSTQFAWETEDGQRFITHYDGDWRYDAATDATNDTE